MSRRLYGHFRTEMISTELNISKSGCSLVMSHDPPDHLFPHCSTAAWPLFLLLALPLYHSCFPNAAFNTLWQLSGHPQPKYNFHIPSTILPPPPTTMSTTISTTSTLFLHAAALAHQCWAVPMLTRWCRERTYLSLACSQPLIIQWPFRPLNGNPSHKWGLSLHMLKAFFQAIILKCCCTTPRTFCSSPPSCFDTSLRIPLNCRR